jgi:hypothetical protein
LSVKKLLAACYKGIRQIHVNNELRASYQINQINPFPLKNLLIKFIAHLLSQIYSRKRAFLLVKDCEDW